MYVKGFDNDKYLQMQSANIIKRINQFNKLYLEVGGKLFDDFHATRVLPGFQPDSKIKMLMQIKDRIEIMMVINAEHIEKNKLRGDYGITYYQDLMRQIDAFSEAGLEVSSVVITHYNKQNEAQKLKRKLERSKIKVAYHYTIANYPNDIDLILSKDGFGKNDYIRCEKDIIVVVAPGPGSGKMATCLSQMYHDNLNGIKSGYAKFETFPVWDLPINHPVNLAYEAATADLDDVNMIDPFHLAAYNKVAVNYNRDVEVFPVLNDLLKQINGSSIYNSPTDMGVNMVASCIIDDEACQEASKQEIIRRYYEAQVIARKEESNDEAVNKLKLIMKKAEIDPEIRKVVSAALKKAKDTNEPAVAIELLDGEVVTGKTSKLLGASSAAILNALKKLAKIPDIKLLSSEIIKPIQKLKTEYLGGNNPRLHTDEVLIALAIESLTNETCKLALSELEQLRYCQVHSTVILSEVDVRTFKKLGMHLTMEPIYQSKHLYHKK